MGTCVCGHVLDEHEEGFLATCVVPDDMTEDGTCPCIDYDEAPVD